MKIPIKNSYKLMSAIGFIIWIAETAYFGWNETAQSAAERILDTLSLVLIFWGIFGDIATNLTIKKGTHINAKQATIYHNCEEQ